MKKTKIMVIHNPHHLPVPVFYHQAQLAVGKQIILGLLYVLLQLKTRIRACGIAHLPHIRSVLKAEHDFQVFRLRCTEPYPVPLKMPVTHHKAGSSFSSFTKSSSSSIRLRVGTQNREAISAIMAHNTPVLFRVR